MRQGNYVSTTSDGREQAGFGSILQLQLLLYSYCKIYGANYCFTGFKNIAHNMGNAQKDFDQKLTKFVNLPKSSRTLEGLHIPENYLMNQFVGCNINRLQEIISTLYDRINYVGPLYFKDSYFNITIHIRVWNSWDLQNNSNVTTENIYQRDIYCKDLNQHNLKYYKSAINYAVSRAKKPIKLHIFSQGAIEDFNDFSEYDIEYHLNDDLVSTFYHLVISDVLIASKSSLSWSAHLYGVNKLVIARNDYWHPWYNGTILLGKNGMKIPKFLSVIKQIFMNIKAIF